MDESRTIDKYKNLFQDVKKVQSLQTGYESIFLGIKDGTKVLSESKKNFKIIYFSNYSSILGLASKYPRPSILRFF